MTAAILYFATAAILLGLAHRFVRRAGALSALVLVLIPLCFTGRALLSGRVYGPVDVAFATEPLLWMRGGYGLPARIHNGGLSDVACQMIPWRGAVNLALQKREWPLWNPYLFGGGPLAASAQPAPYSPFTLAACLLPIGTGTTYLASIWFFVAALSAFLFALEIGCRESAALFAAAGWPFCASLAFFILWPLGQSWALLPFVLFATHRLVVHPRLASTLLLIVAFVLLIVAGHPETVLHVVFVSALYGLFLLIVRRTDVIRALVHAVSAGFLALLITAVYLLPIAEALPQTRDYIERNRPATSQVGTNGRDALARLAIDFFPWMQSRTWNPALRVGPSPFTAAAGSLVVALAIFAIWRVRSPQSWFFFALLVMGLVSGTNWQPVARAWKALPLFKISLNDYFAFAAAFSFVVLAALALEHAAGRSEWRLLGTTVAATAITLTPITVLAGRAGVVGPNLESYGEFRAFAEIAIPALAVLVLLFRAPARYAAAALIVLLLAQRVLEEGGVYPVFPSVAAYPPIPIFAALRGASQPFRIVGQGLVFIPGTSTLYGLEDVRGYTAMTFAPIVETWRIWCREQPVWFNRVDDLDAPFLSFLNVRYAITWAHEREHEGWTEVARQRGSKLLQNTRALERAFIPLEVGLGNRDPIEEMAVSRDFRQRAWIRTPGVPLDQPNGAGTLRIERRRSGFRLHAEMRTAGWIVLSEQFWRGWRAYIDKRRVKIFPANIAFLSVYVPEGRHVVDVRYWPESFVIGRAISGITLLLLLAGGAGRALVRWRPRQDSNLRPTA